MSSLPAPGKVSKIFWPFASRSDFFKYGRRACDWGSRAQGIRFLRELEVSQLRKFRSLWRDGNFAALKKLERLRAFFGFAQESGWTANNPAKRIKSPTVTQPPTMPFTREKMVDIFAACDKYKDNYGRTGQSNGRRLRTFVLVLRYSGLRIRDVVTLPKSKIVKRTAIPLHRQNRNPSILPASGLCGGGARDLSRRQRNLFLLVRPISTEERRGRLATQFAQAICVGRNSRRACSPVS